MTENQQKEYIDERWFKETPEGVALVGVKCKTCNKVFFPQKEVCPVCFDSELNEVSLSKRGKLHTYTVSEMGVTGIETPYACGFIDLPEGIKLFTLLTECEPWDRLLKIGMEMEMVIGTIRKEESGKEIIGYKFRPVK